MAATRKTAVAKKAAAPRKAAATASRATTKKATPRKRVSTPFEQDGPAPLVMDLTGSGVASEALEEAERKFEESGEKMMAAIIKWARTTQPKNRFGTVWDRDRYLAPKNVFEQIRTARQALDDDIVGNAADLTEKLALKKIQFFCEDRNQEDVWNQWSDKTVRLLRHWKALWRVMFTDSNVAIGVWWGTRTYRVRGKTKSGNQARKAFANLEVPLAFTLIDTLKVVPVGTLLFGREQLAYCATAMEDERFAQVKGISPAGKRRGGRTPRPSRVAVPNEDGNVQTLADPIVERLLVGRYKPDEDERQRFQEMAIDTERMWLLRDGSVFRHTATRPDFKPFAEVRLKRVFGWLDLKANLMQMDRAHVVGGTNFIIVVTQGTDQNQAEPEEINHLKGMVQTLATVPVLVGPHGLKVEIVTPKQDHTLKRDRYDAIDVRVWATVMKTFLPTGVEKQDTLKLGKLIAQGLEADRNEIVETFFIEVFDEMVARNEELSDVPTLLFIPGQVALEFDDALQAFILEMRSNNEMSRFSALSQFEFDQDLERKLREREEEDGYDDVFKTQDPNGTPNPANPAQKRAAGRTGGRKGGAAPGTGQGQPARNVTKKSD